MKSNRSLCIIVGGTLLLLAVCSLQRWFSKHEAPIVASEESSVPESRRSGAWLPLGSRSFPAPTPTPIQPSSAPHQKLFVEWKGSWYPAEILASSSGSNYIRYSGYGAEWDEWVTTDRMRYSTADLPVAAPQIATTETPPNAPPTEDVRITPQPGDSVVLWGDRWWRAEVLKTDGDKSLIRYVGYGAEWDEWVGADRFKMYSEEDARNSATTATQPETTALPEPEINTSSLIQGKPARGELLVEWNKQWWPAEILKQEGASYLIHYKGYGSSWDEWVTIERLGIYSGDR